MKSSTDKVNNIMLTSYIAQYSGFKACSRCFRTYSTPWGAYSQDADQQIYTPVVLIYISAVCSPGSNFLMVMMVPLYQALKEIKGLV
jgi:hypothetical protein